MYIWHLPCIFDWRPCNGIAYKRYISNIRILWTIYLLCKFAYATSNRLKSTGISVNKTHIKQLQNLNIRSTNSGDTWHILNFSLCCSCMKLLQTCKKYGFWYTTLTTSITCTHRIITQLAQKNSRTVNKQLCDFMRPSYNRQAYINSCSSKFIQWKNAVQNLS